MKGIFYVAQGRLLPQDFISAAVDAHSLRADVIAEVADFMVPWQSFGDSVFCCRYVISTRKPFGKMSCLMQFYEHRLFYGEAVSLAYTGSDGEVFVASRAGSPILVPRWTVGQ